jgi:cytochrome c
MLALLMLVPEAAAGALPTRYTEPRMTKFEPLRRPPGLRSILSLLLALNLAPAGAQPVDRVALGAALYEKHCADCHSPDVHRAGPAHRGVFGRRVGQAPGFDYSPALKASTLVWDAKTLEAWLRDPEKLIPGQQMFVQIDDPTERKDLIAFLRTLR